MIRFLVRTLGLWLLAGGFAAAVVDGMKSIAASGVRMTSSFDAWAALSGASQKAALGFVEGHLGGAVAAGLTSALQTVPLWGLLGGIGAVLIAVARPRGARVGVTP